MEDNNLDLQEKLLQMKKQKIETDKMLLKLELVICYISIISFLVLVYIAGYIPMNSIATISIVVLACLILIVGAVYALKIEQIAGFYECKMCKHKYVPKYINVFLAMHIGRTRYMKCPNCGKKSWNKKVISND